MSAVGCRQLMVLAMIRAQVVFPTPLGPQNRNAWASVLLRMAFFRVVVIDCWPTTVSKVTGLYFRADTMKFSIDVIDESNYKDILFSAILAFFVWFFLYVCSQIRWKC